MKLKHYQEKVLTALSDYLAALNDAKADYIKVLAINRALASTVNFPQFAWEKATNKKRYFSKTNSLGEFVPDVYLKIPTGGGKTLLACYSIDLIQKIYLQKQTGLVLWVVPSTQIYRQTISALKDRNHPYRQLLDIATGGRVLIREKGERFTRQDSEESLIILLLMLPSANRLNKETLKVFRDAGGFSDFFPAEDNYLAQKELLDKIPNLDYFGTVDEVFQRQVKTSLGNVLRVIKPLIIIDEGHKAYSAGARDTINDFNPSFILELSATPPPDSNLLVQIGGRELHEEEMIKLDIHLVNKSSSHWQDTMLASLEKLKSLDELAKSYSANTGQYIRPAMLVQVERTGKDQRVKDFIHAEDVKEFLIKQCGIPETEIAIKSSEKDDIEGIDLFAENCPIRFIITKQALQEGWDFSFAYVLTILTNPASATGITQLVGRILRQPYAKKTA
jgi:type III restriction enzyme